MNCNHKNIELAGWLIGEIFAPGLTESKPIWKCLVCKMYGEEFYDFDDHEFYLSWCKKDEMISEDDYVTYHWMSNV